MTATVRDAFSRVFPFWSSLPDTEQETLVRAGRALFFKAGSIIHDGTDYTGLFLVQRGSLRVYMTSEEGREITLFPLYEKDLCVFGSACVLRPVTCHAHLAAEMDTDLLMVPHPVWEDVMRRNLTVECFAYKLSRELLSTVLSTMQQMLFWDFETRLAYHLVREYERTGEMRIRTTHEKIARNIGSAREVVTRMLKRFSDLGMVEVRRGAILILNIQDLRAMIPRGCE
jgi:CRP/FNR family transcriptional regulator